MSRRFPEMVEQIERDAEAAAGMAREEEQARLALLLALPSTGEMLRRLGLLDIAARVACGEMPAGPLVRLIEAARDLSAVAARARG